MLKVAIIGAGQVAQTAHVTEYLKYKDEVEIVGVVNWNIGKAKDFAERNGIPHYFENMDDMFAELSVDAVSICTPNRYHYDHVMHALQQNAHVLCEKPPAITAQQAMKMTEYAKKQGRILAYNFQHRFSDDVKELKKALTQGMLGDIYVADAIALRRNGIPGWGTFINKDAQGGGPLIDLGIHMLDVLFYLLDYPKIEKVTAKTFQRLGKSRSTGKFGSWDPKLFTVEDSAFAFLQCEGGLLIRVETSYALNIKEESRMGVKLMGDKAGAELFPLNIFTDNSGDLEKITERSFADDKRQEKSIRHFIDACQGNETMLATGDQGYFVQLVIEEIYKAAEEAGGN